MAVKISYNGSQIASTEESGNINITYNGNTIATMSEGQTKTVNCNGKYMLSNLVVGSKTLQCANKIMASNIGVEYEASGIALTITKAGSSTARSGYYQSYIMVNGVAYSATGTYYFPAGTTVDVYAKSRGSTYTATVSINGKSYTTKSTSFSKVASFEIYDDTANLSVSLMNSSSTSTTTISYIRTATPLVTITSAGSTSTSVTQACSYMLVNGSTTVTNISSEYYPIGTQIDIYVKPSAMNSSATVEAHKFAINSTEELSFSSSADTFYLVCSFTLTSEMSDISIALINQSYGVVTTNLNITTNDCIITSVGGGKHTTTKSLTSGYMTIDGTEYLDRICLILPVNTQIRFYGKAGGSIGTYYAVVKLNGTEVGTKTTDKSNIVLLYTYTVTTDATIDLNTSVTNRIMTITT